MRSWLSGLILIAAPATYPKDPPAQVILWPETGTPVLQIQQQEIVKEQNTIVLYIEEGNSNLYSNKEYYPGD